MDTQVTPGRRRRSKEITKPQRLTLKAIEEHIRLYEYPPTMQEVATARGVTVATAHAQVKQLERKGFLKREPHKARGLTMLRSIEDPVEGLTSVPLIGRTPAGYPVLAEENIIGEVLVEARVAADPCFALQVTGHSMKDKICDGDIVVVRQQPLAESGDVVVALVDGEATVKRLFMSGSTIELRPDNSRMRPIKIGPNMDLRILGKVVAVRRAPGKRPTRQT